MIETLKKTNNRPVESQQTTIVKTFVISPTLTDDPNDKFMSKTNTKRIQKVRQRIKDANVNDIAKVIAYLLYIDVSHVNVSKVFNHDRLCVEYHVTIGTDYDPIAEDATRQFVRTMAHRQERGGFNAIVSAWRYAI